VFKLHIVVCLGVGVSLFCGCASTPTDDLSRLLKELEDVAVEDTGEKGEPVEAARLELPEVPDSGLPSLKASGREGLKPEDAGISTEGVEETLPPRIAEIAGVGGGAEITIQPDCLVQVSVAEDPGLDGSYPVNEIGAVQLGYIGPVILFNKTEREAEKKITKVLENRHFRKATVDVRILRASYDKMQVIGGVNRPGMIKIGAGDSISLKSALLRAGGLQPSPSAAKVKIVKEGLLSPFALALDGELFSLVDEDGEPSIPDVTVSNNDVVYVYSVGSKGAAGPGAREILVLGEVSRQGIYSFSPVEPCTVMHLYFKMGGLPPYANKKAVRIVRTDTEGYMKEFKVNVNKILDDGNPDKDVALESGDRVIVPARRISLF